MMRRSLLAAGLLLATATSVGAHDLFLKLESFFVPPDTPVRVRVLNGTFTKSENAVTRDRIADLSLVTPAGRSRPDPAAWSDAGKSSTLRFRTAEPGTYLVGLSTLPRRIALEATEFNEYLATDGVPDMLAARQASGTAAKPARELYSKHVKALIQVGDRATETYGRLLGYPAEIVPLENPYLADRDRWLRVRAYVDGQPVPNQLVLAGGRHARGGRLRVQSVRTDSAGVARIRADAPGQWYIKFIHMTPVASDSLDYESKWATLTFEVR